MINHVERIKLIVKLDLKLQCEGQIYVITAMYIYLLKELQQLRTLQQLTDTQIIPIKRLSLKIVRHLLAA